MPLLRFKRYVADSHWTRAETVWVNPEQVTSVEPRHDEATNICLGSDVVSVHGRASAIAHCLDESLHGDFPDRAGLFELAEQMLERTL